MRDLGVELCDFSRPENPVPVAQDETHLSRQHVEPFVAIVGAWFRVDLAMLRMPAARGDSATAGMRMR